VTRHQLVTADLHPVFGLRHAGSVLRVDAKPERRAPEEVGDEAHAGAVVREDPRTRSLEALLGDDRLIGPAIEVGLHDAVRPEDARHVDARARAQAEMRRLAGENLSLRQQAASNFYLSADAERVDALVAGGRLRLRPHDLPVIAL